MVTYKTFTESVVEQAALAWLDGLGYRVFFGPAIDPGEPATERDDYSQVTLDGRLRQALARLNPTLPSEALEDAFNKLARADAPTPDARNRVSHRMLTDGINVEYRLDGEIRGAQAWVLDFENPENNDWLAVNQFTVSENRRVRRFDIILFVNGLPLAVIELKNAADENATIWTAFQQLQTYRAKFHPFSLSTRRSLFQTVCKHVSEL